MRRIASVWGVLAVLVSVSPGRADDDAKPGDVIAKAIKAHGGADTIKKLKASVVKTKGKYYGMGAGIDFTSETSIQMPDRARLQVEFEANGVSISFVQVLDGDKGWRSFNGKDGKLTGDLNKEMITEGQEQQYAQSVERLVPLTEKSYKLSSLGESKVGDRPAIGVRVEREGHRPVNLFFDKEKSLLLKSETHGKDPMNGDKEFTTEKIYDDYKEVDGLMTAQKITIKHDGKDFADSEVTDVKLSEKLDDSVFAKP
jgi:hypothetical protein